MDKDTIEMVKRLNFENLIWVVFIVISVLDIYGDELIKKSLICGDKNSQKKADKLFLTLTAISIPIYIYFLSRNYKDYRKHHNKSYEVRYMGSIFVLIGTLCFLYFQLTTRRQTDSPSNV